jgi:hypothetical protein
MDYNIYIKSGNDWVALPHVATFTVGWYDVSKDSGRDTTTADGKMILNVISNKFRIDVTSTYMTGAELNNFFSTISVRPTMEVKFYDPYSASVVTKTMYRGDRTAQIRYSNQDGSMFEPITIALIEL